MPPLDKNLKKLSKLLNVLDEDQLTGEQFIKSFKTVIEAVNVVKAQNALEVKKLKEEITRLSSKLQDGNASEIKSLTLSLEKKIDKSLKAQEVGMNMVRDKLRTLKDGIDGKDADRDDIVHEVLELMPPIPVFESDTGEEIRNKLEALVKDERLDHSAIKGLEEFIKTFIPKGQTRFIGEGGGGGGKVSMWTDISSSLDGVTKTFSLPAFHRILIVQLSSQPTLRQEVDFTVDPTNMQITFTSQIDASTELASGQSCIVIYAE